MLIQEKMKRENIGNMQGYFCALELANGVGTRRSVRSLSNPSHSTIQGGKVSKPLLGCLGVRKKIKHCFSGLRAK